MAPQTSILSFLWSIHSFMLWPQLPPTLITLPGLTSLDTFTSESPPYKISVLLHIPLLAEEENLQTRQHMILLCDMISLLAGTLSCQASQRGKKGRTIHSFHLFPTSTSIKIF